MPIDSDYPTSEESTSNSENSTAKSDSKDKEEYSTALIPKSILGGKECKPGEKLEFEVVSVMEDEIEVKFSGYKDEKKENEDDDNMRGAMRRSMASMDEMALAGNEA